MPTIVRRTDKGGATEAPRPTFFQQLARFARKRPRRFAALCAAVAAPCLYVAWLLLKPTGPDDVARVTVYALQRRDVQPLLALTLPEERTRLNLQETTVQKFLDQTMWTGRGLPAMRLEQLGGGPPDEIAYRVTGASDAMHHFPFRVMVTQAPDGSWHLALGKLLLAAAFVKSGTQDVRATRQVWGDLCARTGVVGYRENSTGYVRANPDGSATRMAAER